ncbi:MAG: hypothetical protein IPL96_13445 [Holophagaceae bacterium]|nr:hypothetical protein [Holophagaceae bacterium]
MRRPTLTLALAAMTALAALPAAQGMAALPAAAPRKAAATVLEGQVVCSLCWFEADRAVTPYGAKADLECADRCAKAGKPQALAVAEGKGVTLYLLGPGRLKRSRGDWLDVIARRVKATGRVTVRNGQRHLSVDALEVLPDSAPGS